jgi:hypothetical protein
MQDRIIWVKCAIAIAANWLKVLAHIEETNIKHAGGLLAHAVCSVELSEVLRDKSALMATVSWCYACARAYLFYSLRKNYFSVRASQALLGYL